MKVLALCVVILAYASIMTVGFFTPSPEKHNSGDDFTVDEGGVVIGIQNEDGSTKVSVSPHEEVKVGEEGVLGKAKEKLKEASSSMKKGGDSAENIDSYTGRKNGAAEKVAEAVREAVGKAKDKAHEAKASAKDAASDVSSKAKDKVTNKASEMKEGAKEKMKGAAEEAEQAVKDKGKKGLKGVFAHMVSAARMASSAGVLHLLGFSSAYGMCVWVTFGSNYVLSKVLPRHQCAMVQSKMHPVYFKAMASSVGVALLGHVMGQRGKLPRFRLESFDLVAPLAMILVNLLYLEPRATKLMLQRMKKEKEEGSGKEGDVTATGAETTEGEKQEEAASKSQNIMSQSGSLLGMLNSYSSLLNAATLMPLTWHLVHLSQQIHAAC